MALDKQGNFSQQPSELPDVPSPSMTPDQIRAKWQTPLDEFKTTFNNAIDKLNSTTDGASGADNVGATGFDGVASTIQALLEYLNTNKATKGADWTGTWQGFNPSQVDQTIRDQVNTNTSQLANILSYEIYLKSYPIQAPENNDTGRFQRALNDLVANGGGRLILEKNFTYNTSSDLTWKSNNIQIISPFGTTIKPVNCNGFNYGDSTGATRYNYTSFVGLNLDMSGASGKTGIVSNNADETYFTDVQVTSGGIGIDLIGSYNITMLNVICILQTTAGLRTDCSDKLLVIRGQFGNGEKGILIRGGKAISFIGVSIERNNAEAIAFITSMTRGGEYPDGVLISGCYMERNAMMRGNAFLELGTYNPNINDYAHGFMIVSNYFNWDVGNPRTPVVPIYNIDRLSSSTIQGNKYTNTSNYATMTSNADKYSISTINDPAYKDIKTSTVVNGDLKQYIIPFNVNVATDATGHGQYNYDLSSFTFSNFYGAGNPSVSSTSTLVDIVSNGTTCEIIVNGGPTSSSIGVTGLIVGVWN